MQTIIFPYISEDKVTKVVSAVISPDIPASVTFPTPVTTFSINTLLLNNCSDEHSSFVRRVQEFKCSNRLAVCSH